MKKFFLLFFLTSLLVVASVTANSARTVGVSVGDWFKYEDITATWSSNDPNASPPAGYWIDFEMLNQTEWVSVEITGVSGTNVTVQSIRHLKNGTEEISGGWIDVDTGDGVNQSTMIIGANLNEGDPIYTAEGFSTWLIDETISREYPGPDSSRETNHINVTWELYTFSFYLDKSTGILVESSVQLINQTEEYLTTLSSTTKITESNVWVVPEFPNLIVWLAVTGIATAALLFGKRRLSKNKSLIFK